LILGVGVDSLETVRVERELSRAEWLADDGIFTAGEIGFCRSTRFPARHFAACFAAKEAAMKALGLRVSDLAMFREIELEHGTGSEVGVTLHGRLKRESERLGVRCIHLSFAQRAGRAEAVVILEA